MVIRRIGKEGSKVWNNGWESVDVEFEAIGLKWGSHHGCQNCLVARKVRSLEAVRATKRKKGKITG